MARLGRSPMHLAEEVISDTEKIVFVDNPPGQGGFAYGWKSGNGWWYWYLVLSCRGQRNLLKPAARLYRRLKRAGALKSWQTFKYVAM